MIRSYAAGRRMICRCGLSSTIQLHSDKSHAMVYRQLSCHGMQTTCRQRVRQLCLDSHITHTEASWNRFRTTWSALQQLLVNHGGLQMFPAA